MGIKAAYSPKQSIWDGGLEGDGHGHSSWQHPTLDGTRLSVQFGPLFLAPLSLQSVGSGSTSADRQNYCMFSARCLQDGKASKTSPKGLGCIQTGLRPCTYIYDSQNINTHKNFCQWLSDYTLSGCSPGPLKSHVPRRYAKDAVAHSQQQPLRSLGTINGPRSNIRKAGQIKRKHQSAHYLSKQ